MDAKYSINKQKNIALIFAILYTFRFALKVVGIDNGNYDSFYLIGLWGFLTVVIKRKKNLKTLIQVCFILTFISIINFLFSVIKIDVSKNVIWILKFGICYCIYILAKDKLHLLLVDYFLHYCGIILFMQVIVALLNRNDILWRVKEGRLQLFFIEPSDLGMFVGVLATFSIYRIIVLRKTGNSYGRHVFDIAVFIATILLSQSAAGVIYLFVGIICVLFYDVLTFKTYNNSFFKFIVLIFISILLIGIIIISDSYISMRIVNMANGQDSSFYSRISYSYEKVIDYYKNNGFAGCGFGNQNSKYGIEFFKYDNAKNLLTCAAFATFALEGGLIGVIVGLIYIAKSIKNIKKIYFNKELRFSLMIIVLLYLFSGGYLTNPCMWGIIGCISYRYEIKCK